MAKKTPEEIEALKQAAAQKKEAARLAAEKKAAEELRTALIKKLQDLGWPSQVMAEDLTNEELQAAIEAQESAAVERASLIQTLTELEFPASLEDLSNEELKQALDAYNLVANQGEQAGAQVTQIVTNAIANQPQSGTQKPKSNLENISNIANKQKVSALFIKSVPESFCRCGRRFTREGYGIALDVLTEDEIKRLKDEPNLFVEEVEALIDNVEH